MKVDVSGLTFRDADKSEKKSLYWLMSLRSLIMSLVAVVALTVGIYLLVRYRAINWLSVGCFAIEIVLFVDSVIIDLPPWTCTVCFGTVKNKREVYPDEETGLYYDAVTFTSDANEVKDAIPVFSEKTLALLEDGSRAVIVCYNKREPVLFAEEQMKRRNG